MGKTEAGAKLDDGALRARWYWGAGGALALAGGYLLYRQLSDGKATQGRSPIASVRHGEGVKVAEVVTILASPDKLYAFWRDFRNLPRFMTHLKQVEVISSERSRWTVDGPFGREVRWEATIHNDVPGELIAWRSVESADVANAGSVRFTPAPAGRGTEVRVTLEYAPPAGGAGALAAGLFGPAPSRQVADSLRELKRLFETGTALSTKPGDTGQTVALAESLPG